MKQFYLIAFSMLFCSAAKTQAVLNEIYAEPGASDHEFFELYNTSPSQSPMSVDGYTLITYFDDGKETGFYVLDLPALSMASKGYLVGSAASPYNYQGHVGSTATNFNWNNPADMASNYGYLKKWIKGTANTTDGNAYYDEVPIAGSIDDLFTNSKSSGYVIFLLKDGNLVNFFIGAAKPTPSSYITGLPEFNLQSVTSGGNNNYSIKFGPIASMQAENVDQSIGTNNGFMRTSDGMCGTWEKSSSQSEHTPQAPNGGSQMAATGTLTIETHLSASAPAFVAYSIPAGPADMFPVQIYVYADNGSVPGSWDAADEYVGGNTIPAPGTTPYTTPFSPFDQDLILVAKAAVGCFDQVLFLPNNGILAIALPVRLISFTGTVDNSNATLAWTVSENKSALHYELEKSSNGKDFIAAGVIASTNKPELEYYYFTDQMTHQGLNHYRLKVINKDKTVAYSKVIALRNAGQSGLSLQILQNPVQAALSFSCQSAETEPATISIYNAVGLKLLSTQKTTQKGTNTFSISLEAKFSSGTYILEVVSKSERSVTRFIKH